MAELGCVAVLAGVNFVVDNGTAADAGAQRQHNPVAELAAVAHPFFAHNRDGRIVFKKYANAGAFMYMARKRMAAEAEDVRACDNYSIVLVD